MVYAEANAQPTHACTWYVHGACMVYVWYGMCMVYVWPQPGCTTTQPRKVAHRIAAAREALRRSLPLSGAAPSLAMPSGPRVRTERASHRGASSSATLKAGWCRRGGGLALARPPAKRLLAPWSPIHTRANAHGQGVRSCPCKVHGRFHGKLLRTWNTDVYMTSVAHAFNAHTDIPRTRV